MLTQKEKLKSELDDKSAEKDKIQSNKKSKSKLLEGYKQIDYDVSEAYHKDYMSQPEDKCTFLRTGNNFENQHWYFCYTCGLTGDSGACSVCVKVCHAGHHVVYAKKSSFFCDCRDCGNCKFQSDLPSLQPPAFYGMGSQPPNSKRPYNPNLFGQPPKSTQAAGFSSSYGSYIPPGFNEPHDPFKSRKDSPGHRFTAASFNRPMSRMNKQQKREPRDMPPSFSSTFGASSLAKAHERIVRQERADPDPLPFHQQFGSEAFRYVGKAGNRDRENNFLNKAKQLIRQT